MIKVGIVGGSGYTAGELIRILVHHPQVSIDFIYSTTNSGKAVTHQHQDLLGETTLLFTDRINPAVDVVFLCLGHGKSKTFLNTHDFSSGTKVIDLSNDFRLQKESWFKERSFIYGLPELHKNSISKAKNIANPGCFATAIQLALLPLAKENMLQNSIHINATTGSTGAGVLPSDTTHFSWRDNNFSSYKVFEHQHLDEIGQSLEELQEKDIPSIYFVPNRGNFSKGIYASVYTKFDGSDEQAIALYKQFYKDSSFTLISNQEIHLKQVINTNKCILHITKKKDMLVVTSIIDNLIKGASGQAVQNMNLMCGIEEYTGLQLKGNAF
ncbi:N-acetyl-gamma-glutamyl-phosphate reductase [Aquimarina brevivitae]|uniref:N-acetyl-gamma-glutamyl-phosphate reductase n=1 Tax=Aquimarina brevivitae TaxID=323412 RepID=A0A4Q7NYZ2_9FLAO|nr:N-acetyl-gamma-glutamyl-phosphate reductase [Aquimarina brevivitae]RZS92477.1 N-acetyl-gamma-glutamyl-phosphate reductase [Aquimarina brevivitae]